MISLLLRRRVIADLSGALIRSTSTSTASLRVYVAKALEYDAIITVNRRVRLGCPPVASSSPVIEADE